MKMNRTVGTGSVFPRVISCEGYIAVESSTALRRISLDACSYVQAPGTRTAARVSVVEDVP